MTTIPPNHVEMIQQPGGGWKILLDGYDLAPHVDHWKVEPAENASDGPVLTVRIPTESLAMSDESEDGHPPAGFRYVQRPSDKEPRLVPVVSGPGVKDPQALADAISRTRDVLGGER